MDNRYNDPKYLEYLSAKAIESKRKTPLVFAILGLLLGMFMGVGIIFSLLAIATYFKNKKLGGTSLKWALVLGIVGVILNLAFIVSLQLIILLSKTPMPL